MIGTLLTLKFYEKWNWWKSFVGAVIMLGVNLVANLILVMIGINRQYLSATYGLFAGLLISSGISLGLILLVFSGIIKPLKEYKARQLLKTALIIFVIDAVLGFIFAGTSSVYISYLTGMIGGR